MTEQQGPLDFYAPVEASALPRSKAVRPGEAPPWLAQISAAARGAAGNDAPGADEARRLHAMDDALAPIVAELEQRGVRVGPYAERQARNMWARTYNVDTIWRGIARARAIDGKAFSGVESDPAAFRQRVTAPVDARIAQDRDVQARSSWTPWLAGQLVGGASDPENLVPIGVAAGRARGVAQAALQGAVANAQAELAFQPLRSIEAAKAGAVRGFGDAAADVALAAGTGGLLGGAIHAGQRPGTALAQQLRERIGWSRMTSEERGAAQTLERLDGIVESSPFRPGRDTQAYTDAVATRLAEVKAGAPLHPEPTWTRAAQAPGRDLSPDAVITNTFRLEGGPAVVGYSAADGGLTKYGIAAKFNPGVDVANLTEAQARVIAKRKYWFRELDMLEPRTAAVVFDAGYISGPKVARRILRESRGDADRALDLYRAHLNRIADTVPGKARYRKGWNARVDGMARFVGERDGPQLRRDIFADGAEGDAEWQAAQRDLDAATVEADRMRREPMHVDDDIPFDLDDPRGRTLASDRDPFEPVEVDPARWNVMAADEDAPILRPADELVDDRAVLDRADEDRAMAEASAEGAAREADDVLDTDRADYTPPAGMEPTKNGIPQERFDVEDRSIAGEEMRRSWREDIAAGRKPQPMYVVRPVTGEDAMVATPSWTLAERTRRDPPLPVEHEIFKVHAPDDVAALAPARAEPVAGFDDPHGEEAIRQADSLEHDLRMFLREDEAAGMTVRLNDEGDVMNAADLLDELEGDEAAIAAARACMMPGTVAAA